jgi:hypothetical protein
MFRLVVLAIVMALTAPASAGEFKPRAETAPAAKPAVKPIAKRVQPQRRAKAAPKKKPKTVAKRERRPLP